MNTAIYTNKALNETHKISGVSGIEQAWNLAEYVCRRKGWNFEAFCLDCNVRVIYPIITPKSK